MKDEELIECDSRKCKYSCRNSYAISKRQVLNNTILTLTCIYCNKTRDPYIVKQ